MDTSNLIHQFGRMGARAKIDLAGDRNGRAVALDIRRDRHGEFFLLSLRAPMIRRLDVVDVKLDMRHLLLLADTIQVTLPSRRAPESERVETDLKSKFLCGHDERHWFVAAVPEAARASGVRSAMEALMPGEVRKAVELAGVDGRRRLLRRNPAFRRQGEWFFVPVPDFRPGDAPILTDEPLARPGGKPHRVDQLVRLGGETVYVSSAAPAGLTAGQYAAWCRAHPNQRGITWTVMRRNPQAFARGRVRHADHATLTLQGWHRVFMNTESQAKAMRHVVFLD